jgi:hypothetical protein
MPVAETIKVKKVSYECGHCKDLKEGEVLEAFAKPRCGENCEHKKNHENDGSGR